MRVHHRDNGLFAFAGLWDEWQAPDGSPIRSCTIITTAPNN
jgi:putative SOS response-associated peptidase YedK